MTRRQKVLVIVGPTASGKTALSIMLARRFGGEVVSADSRQVYRALDIGTGKVTVREMRGVPHHLLDVASPKNVFTAGDFVKRGRRALADIAQRDNLPIIAGGTGFYIDALVSRISLPEVPPNVKLRARLRDRSAMQLYALLQKRDPARARALASESERSNAVRLIRALEVASARGQKIAAPNAPALDAFWVGITPRFAELEKKIHARLVQRIRRGMITEAKRLHANGLSYKRMEALGLEYRSQARYLQGRITKEEMIAELDRDIRRYAKKQLAYWKRNPDIRWFKPTETQRIEKAVANWLKK